MSGSPKMTNRFPLPVFLRSLGHVQVSVHPSFEHGDAAQLAELRSVRLVIESAGDQHIEPSIAGLTGAGDKIGALHGAELGADEDGGHASQLRLRGNGLPRRPVRRAHGVRAVKVIRSPLCACCTPAVLRFSRIICGKDCFDFCMLVAGILPEDRLVHRSHLHQGRDAG